MSTLEEKITIMQAYQQGKKIESQKKYQTYWNDSPNPIWDWFQYDYRIKEEPKKKVKLYLVLCLDKRTNYFVISNRYYASIEEAQNYLTLFKVIKLLPHTMIEVEEE